MQLVLRDGLVIATHDDDQRVADLYPGCEVVSYVGILPASTPDAPFVRDPRTAEEKARRYQDQRRNEYPTLAEQLDMLYWDKRNGTLNWYNMVTGIKNRNPKP